MKEDAFSLLGIGVVGLGIAVVGGHLFTRWVLRKIPLPEEGDTGLLGAGALIGHLERSFVFLVLFAGYPSLVGFALMAKSIARFDELRDRQFAEYFLVGTLASVLFALAVGLLCRFWSF